MTDPRAHYSDDERERLRKALHDYAQHFELSAQQLSDRIAETTGYALELDAGRKRVERFLKNSHRQPDDFIGAIAAYLGTVPSPDIEQMAASLAHFFAREVPRPVSIDNLAGRYLVWASTDRRPEESGGISEITTLDFKDGFRPIPPLKLGAKIPYAVVDLRPFPKSHALMVSEAIINHMVNSKVDSFPEELPPTSDAGVFVPFGYSDREVPRFIMTTRMVLETRLYRLHKLKDDPLTLRGELQFNGGVTGGHNMTHSDPLHPDYVIEMVKTD